MCNQNMISTFFQFLFHRTRAQATSRLQPQWPSLDTALVQGDCVKETLDEYLVANKDRHAATQVVELQLRHVCGPRAHSMPYISPLLDTAVGVLVADAGGHDPSLPSKRAGRPRCTCSVR